MKFLGILEPTFIRLSIGVLESGQDWAFIWFEMVVALLCWVDGQSWDQNRLIYNILTSQFISSLYSIMIELISFCLYNYDNILNYIALWYFFYFFSICSTWKILSLLRIVLVSLTFSSKIVALSAFWLWFGLLMSIVTVQFGDGNVGA